MASKQAGQSTREMARRRRKTGLNVLLLALIGAIAISFFVFNSKQFGIGGIGLLILVVLIRVIADMAESFDRHSTKLEKRAVRGAVAEELVGDLLGDLDETFLVLHDVTSAYGNIDHLVLSQKNGLFLIETKSHRGKVTFEGEKVLLNGNPPEKDFIAQTLKNTYWLKQKIQLQLGLEIWVTPILVFTNAFVPFGKPIKGITITNKRYLLEALKKERKGGHNINELWEARERLAKVLECD